MLTTKVGDIERMTQINPALLPNGVYDGVWGGYVVKFDIGDVTYKGNTTSGIRTQRAECRVTVRDGEVTVETK